MSKRAQSRTTRPYNNYFGAISNMMAAFDEKANLLAPYLLVIVVLRRKKKEKQDGKVDFGFVKYLKNAQSLEHTIRLCKSFDWVIENFTSG